MSKAISFDQIETYKKDLEQTPGSAALAKAVQNVGPKAAIQAQTADSDLNFVFSDEIETGKVTNQKQSGRCWLFSGLNTMRHSVAKKIGMKDIEFSQAFNAFYDRLEKANLFLEEIIASADKPLTDRTVSDYLASPNGDGGQFDNAAALVEKYGIVPKYVMPETYSSSKTGEINSSLNLKLRKDASELRQAFADGADKGKLEAQKETQLSAIYRMLAYAYGNPPKTFDFEYRDDKKNFHSDKNLTPKQFFDKYVGWDLDEYVTVISNPSADKKYYQTYTIPAQDNVVGGRLIKFVNVPLETLQNLAIKSIQAGETVWFGNDVGQDSERKSGALRGDLYDYSELFDADLSMDKATRFATREAAVSHAMTFTGVNLVNGQPNRWKVENSWGKENGNDGYFVADQSWFEKYVYQVGVKKSLLDDKTKAALETTPIALTTWDPFN